MGRRRCARRVSRAPFQPTASIKCLIRGNYAPAFCTGMRMAALLFFVCGWCCLVLEVDAASVFGSRSIKAAPPVLYSVFCIPAYFIGRLTAARCPNLPRCWRSASGPGRRGWPVVTVIFSRPRVIKHRHGHLPPLCTKSLSGQNGLIGIHGRHWAARAGPGPVGGRPVGREGSQRPADKSPD